MKVDDFISRVAGEPERTVTRTVWTTPPEVLAQAAKPGGLRMTDFLSASGRRAEQRDVRYRHILGSPAPQQAIDAWENQRPSHRLPGDLQALVSRIDGIHLWANVETGRSYAGLAPIEEWELARVKMYGPSADRSLLDDRYVALSYHQDGVSFVVLDVESGRYFLMDAAGPDTTSPIASNAGELLDWLWRSRIAPKA
ncbi:hypothetical protein BH09MYX1_BH09MYX1_62170 [soil metagenome]